MSKRTITHLYHNRVQKTPQKPFLYYPSDDAESFTPISYRDAQTFAHEVGAGLRSLGVGRGERVVILCDTRYEWVMLDWGSLSLGGVVVAIYPNSTTEQIDFIMKHSGAKVAIVENAHQWEKIGDHLGEFPDLEHVVVLDTDGVPPADWLTVETLRERGREQLAAEPHLMQNSMDALQPTDLAGLVYTSGTTGTPKAVALKHENLYSVTEMLEEVASLGEEDNGVIYLPVAHILQRLNIYYGTRIGVTGYFAPEITALVPTCQAANPTTVSGVPRVFEKIHARIMAGVNQAPERRKNLILSALKAGGERAQLIKAGRPVPFLLKLRYAVYDRLVFEKMRAAIFGNKIEYLVSGAAPLSTETQDFFLSIGLPIYEGYGLTETSSPITLNLLDNHRFGSVGPALPGSEIKIADDGEILLRGPGVFDGYYKNEEATREAFTADGWFRSGDIGELDENGFLKITDRKKNLIITAGGKNIAPAPIENLLVQHPLVSQAMVIGDRQKYLVALLTLDAESVQVWAQEHGKGGQTAAELLEDAQLNAEMDQFVAGVNSQLARYETIKYCRVLPAEFSVEQGTLTPTMKLKRRAVMAEYGELIEGMYV